MSDLAASPLRSIELPTWMNSFTQYVTVERLRQGLSTGELAEIASVPEPQVIEIENNETYLPPVEVFTKIVDALKLDSGVALEFAAPYGDLFYWAFQHATREYVRSFDQQAAERLVQGSTEAA